MLASLIFPETVKGLRYFGLSDDAIFIVLLTVGMLVSYFVLRPVTRLLLRWRAETLMNYLLSSLVVIILLLTWLSLDNHMLRFRLALLFLAGFGVILMVVRIIGRIWRNA
ncbi:hypothetical protein ACFSMW_03000 [Virgibacillus halophilus]|uniref:YesK-like protein n=1 Tax=Tigheibacillus halophilus TaxID=361280 RepID=A0ABU5CA67_9BACI|nr:hypothetical protein [Virgibacillus halophilus]